MFKLLGTERYWEWFSDQNLKIQCQINSRLKRIILYGGTKKSDIKKAIRFMMELLKEEK
jgi:hypothetical protein